MRYLTLASRVLCGGFLLTFWIPAIAFAAGPEGLSRSGPVLFGLAVLVVVAKIGGLLAERWRQPSVLGELLVGIVLSNLLPPVFGGEGIAFVRSEPTLLVLAEIGVLILLFDVGLEADLRALTGTGLSSLLVAGVGVVVPLLLGWGAAAWLVPSSPTIVHVFVGATLSATSVAITVRVLRDLGVMQSREGQIILGAAILDDILGLMVLAVVAGLVTAVAAGGPGLSVLAVVGILLRAIMFLGIAVGIGVFFSDQLVRLMGRPGHPEMMLVFGLGLCFTLAFAAEMVGLAGIVGAFAAGLMLDPYGKGIRVEEEKISDLLYPLSSFFVPLFFVLIGIQVNLGSLASPVVFGFGIVLTICALVGKLACAVGVVDRGVNRLAVAIGMIPRGEVGLIFAGIGASLTIGGEPILSQGVFSAIVMMVLVTTLVTPIGLRWAFHRGPSGKEIGNDK